MWLDRAIDAVHHRAMPAASPDLSWTWTPPAPPPPARGAAGPPGAHRRSASTLCTPRPGAAGANRRPRRGPCTLMPPPWGQPRPPGRGGRGRRAGSCSRSSGRMLTPGRGWWQRASFKRTPKCCNCGRPWRTRGPPCCCGLRPMQIRTCATRRISGDCCGSAWGRRRWIWRILTWVPMLGRMVCWRWGGALLGWCLWSRSRSAGHSSEQGSVRMILLSGLRWCRRGLERFPVNTFRLFRTTVAVTRGFQPATDSDSRTTTTPSGCPRMLLPRAQCWCPSYHGRRCGGRSLEVALGGW
mmetsp:Transcript_96995/g.259116  ORF Transcript_96995/g.259116 Transcript_96995/m.259116 type:complete len:297 (-) Transcript_96995:358-1248(-)